MRNGRIAFLTFILLALLLTGCGLSFASDVTPPPGTTARATQAPVVVSAVYPIVAPDLIAGQVIYAQKCAPCHGETGAGDGPAAVDLPNPPIALSNQQVARQALPADWFTIVSQGALDRFMPGFSASLSDRDIWDVVAYTLNLSTPQQSLASAAADYQTYCQDCHGADGAGNGPLAETVSIPLPDWRDGSQLSNRSLEALYTVTTLGQAPAMPAFQDQLTEERRWALAAYIRAFSLGAPAGLFSAVTEGAAAPEPGTFNLLGRLENGSGGSLPPITNVQLQVLDAMQVSQTLEVPVSSDGEFAFNNLELAGDRVFLVSAEFKGMSFHANPLKASDIRPGDEARLPLRVFETSSDPSALVADRLHVFLDDTGAGTLRVVELYLISNTGNTVVIPASEGQTVVNFTLPPQAFDLQFEDGELGQRFLETPGGFGDTRVVFPGVQQLQVLFAYQIPFDRKAALELRTPLQTRSVIVAVPAEVVTLESPQLTFTGQRTIQGGKISTYEAGMLEAGAGIQLQMRAPMRNPLNRLAQNQLATGLLGAGVFLLVVGAAGYFLKRQANTSYKDIKNETITQEALLDQVLALDDLYQAGKLPLKAYQQRRAELMDRLRELTRS